RRPRPSPPPSPPVRAEPPPRRRRRTRKAPSGTTDPADTVPDTRRTITASHQRFPYVWLGKSDTRDARRRHARRKNCAARLWSIPPLGGNPSAHSARTSPRIATRGITRGRTHSTHAATVLPRAVTDSLRSTFGHDASPRPTSAFSPPPPY